MPTYTANQEIISTSLLNAQSWYREHKKLEVELSCPLLPEINILGSYQSSFKIESSNLVFSIKILNSKIEALQNTTVMSVDSNVIILDPSGTSNFNKYVFEKFKNMFNTILHSE